MSAGSAAGGGEEVGGGASEDLCCAMFLRSGADWYAESWGPEAGWLLLLRLKGTTGASAVLIVLTFVFREVKQQTLTRSGAASDTSIAPQEHYGDQENESETSNHTSYNSTNILTRALMGNPYSRC